MSSDPVSVVRRYYRVAGDSSSTVEDLLPLLHPDVHVTEHPNALSPAGVVLNREEITAALRSGRALLSEQTFTLHEVLAVGDRIAVRATWHGVVGVDRGPLREGTRLTAEVASFVSVRDGQIVGQETFDCYAPIVH